MLNLKLKTIASLINKDDIVIDMACDHAYLAIYLKENNLAKEVYASDISKNALMNANKNIKENNLHIKTYLSDGFKNIPLNLNLNTVIIAGVGTTTILSILKDLPANINKLIISSNNDYELLYQEMFKHKFYNTKEIVIKENNKYYPIILYTKDYQKETKLTLKYGKSNNLEYYNYLLIKKQEILKHIPRHKLLTKYKKIKEIINLKKLIKEKTLDY